MKGVLSMANYDLGNKNDMNKFMRDIERDLTQQVKKDALVKNYDIDCPHCSENVSVPVGKSLCPKCSEEIDLKLDFNF